MFVKQGRNNHSGELTQGVCSMNSQDTTEDP